MLIAYNSTHEIEFSTYRLWLDADDYDDFDYDTSTCGHFHSVRGCF